MTTGRLARAPVPVGEAWEWAEAWAAVEVSVRAEGCRGKGATPPPNSRVKHFHDDCSSCRRWPHLIGLDQFLARSVLNDSRCNQAPFPARIALAECVAAARLADCHTRSGGRHAEYNSFIRQRPNRSRRTGLGRCGRLILPAGSVVGCNRRLPPVAKEPELSLGIRFAL